MPKGEQRSNREHKKPKQPKKPVVPVGRFIPAPAKAFDPWPGRAKPATLPAMLNDRFDKSMPFTIGACPTMREYAPL